MTYASLIATSARWRVGNIVSSVKTIRQGPTKPPHGHGWSAQDLKGLTPRISSWFTPAMVLEDPDPSSGPDLVSGKSLAFGPMDPGGISQSEEPRPEGRRWQVGSSRGQGCTKQTHSANLCVVLGGTILDKQMSSRHLSSVYKAGHRLDHEGHTSFVSESPNKLRTGPTSKQRAELMRIGRLLTLDSSRYLRLWRGRSQSDLSGGHCLCEWVYMSAEASGWIIQSAV